jgi:putative transposase
MSRRRNCWDNAVAESFFSSLKRNESANASIKPGIWPGPTSSITSESFTIGPGGTAIWAMSA